MKKALSILLALLMIVSVLASCSVEQNEEKEKTPQEILLGITDEKERAKKLSEYSDANHEKYTSYKMEMTMSMETTIQASYQSNVTVIADGSVEQVWSGIGTDDFCYYSCDTSSTKLASSTAVSNSKKIQYFKDGVYYLTVEDASLSNPQKLCTEMKAEDFIEYINGSTTSFDFYDCTTVSCTQNQDLSWSVKYEGYTKKAINDMIEELDLDMSLFNADILDVKFAIEVDKDLNESSMSIEFVFEQKAKQPKFVLNAIMSGINSTEPKSSLTKDFTEVDDIVILETLEEKIEDIENDDYGLVKLEISQIVKTGSKVQTVSETDTIRYGLEDDAYFYNIEAKTGDDEYLIKYENGYQSVSVGGVESTKVAKTESDARAFVNGLIRTSNYDARLITSVTKNEDGSYVITTSNPDIKAFKTLISSISLSVHSKEQTYIIKFKDDGSIASIESTLVLKGILTSNGQEGLISSKSELTVK